MRSKRIAYFVVAIVCMVVLWGGSTAQEVEKNLVMPRELVELAEKNGYTQVDDFFDVSNDREGPPFVYGSFDSSVAGAARGVAFWGRKIDDSVGGDWSYYMILATRKFWMARLEIDAVANHIIPCGLYRWRDTTLTLDSFVYVDDEQTRGPANIRLKNVAFRVQCDGESYTYYMYQGRWLVLEEWDL